MTTPYARGRAFEYAVMAWLATRRWHVFRMAGSHGPFDVVAVRGGVTLGIQCKRDGRIGQGALLLLRLLSRETRWVILLADRCHGLRLRQLTEDGWEAWHE